MDMKPSKSQLPMGNIQINTDKQTTFSNGDVVFVVDAKLNGSSFEIKKYFFNAYTDSSYKKATLKDSNNSLIATLRVDAIFPDSVTAHRFTMLYFIKRREPEIHFDNNLCIDDQYIVLEENYPELILKYSSKIKIK